MSTKLNHYSIPEENISMSFEENNISTGKGDSSHLTGDGSHL